ncbi:kinesin-like protein KIF14 isoform X1 [Neodiprion lecontei]|uniref:Kinesin-like protein KIF14 isoform X1 n=2 Tax=Neodiprion lecontei TaxID=441921 RepID=A0A6J0BAV1_NEOLC|nr:kinesin-like protein KIF14 isoform X1 [Neodiprion lecontei]
MSHRGGNTSSTRSLNAIFSSEPINFNKENAPPVKKKFFESPETTDDCVSHIRTSSNSRFKSNLIRSKSVTMLQKEEPSLSAKSSSEERLKTPMRITSNPRLSADRTPVTHFCTPKRVTANERGSKTNIFSITSKTPVKRYFSNHNPPAATPDCFNLVQMETPRTRQDLGADEQTMCEGEQSNLTVGVRVRPLNFKELNDQRITAIVEANGQNITVECESSRHTFMYDHCFVSYADSCTPQHATQEVVFKNMVLPLVENAFEGYNACLFAYGQTGSGKSYSMMGTETCGSELGSEAGIIPRFCHEIFCRSMRNSKVVTTVEISYFEIYNEKIHDLLGVNTSGGKRAPLKVREHPVFGPYVVDLSQHGVNSYEDLQGWLKVGNSQRATAATGMNEKSSRSHSIFSVILTQTQVDVPSGNQPAEPSRRSKINLVDLAGSERLSQTCASGDRLREGVSINKSLLTLGKVIASLAESTNNRKRGFVPYRESVLTWLLRESLGGNSRTAMLGTVSPASVHLEETLATLRYACQARAIVNRVRVNEDSHERLIRELKAEVARLRGIREGYERHLGGLPRRILLDGGSGAAETEDDVRMKEREIEILREQLKKTEKQLCLSQKSWSEKLRDAEEKKNTELTHLRRCGIALEIDFKEKSMQPCLVNLAADPILSGTLLYLLPSGSVRIGRRNVELASSYQPDIVLDGPLVGQRHCTIENNNGKLTLSPEMEGDTYVNGQVVTGKVYLKHGDRLVIGGNHYFRVCNPLDEQGRGQISAQPVDFEFAHQEILKIQQEKLRAELEESKQKVIKELENAKREVEMQLGSQKSTYEEQLQMLGSSLEQQKKALAEVNRRKHELELEKELLASEVETNNRIRQIQSEEEKFNISPYRSNFLQELEDILNETTADVEMALNMNIDSEETNSRTVSLREMQLLVKEASERCREVGINYITEHLNESIHQISMDASTAEVTMDNLMLHPTKKKYYDHVRKYVREMEEAAKNLGNLCNQQEIQEISDEVTKSIEKVQDIIISIKETLTSSRNNESNASNASENNTVIENPGIMKAEYDLERKYFPDENMSPSKSNLKNTCPFLRSGITSKSVRFDFD